VTTRIDKNSVKRSAPEAGFQVINGCVAQHWGQFPTFEGKTGSHGGGSPALLMKLACLGKNDTMRDEVANESDLKLGVFRCSHLHFFLFLLD
jgi:hypothetical protein